MPKLLCARAAVDAEEERKVRTLAASRHAPGDWIRRARMVVRSWEGLLLTTGSFTPDAKRVATRDGAPELDLIDGDDLCMLLKDLGLGVSTKQVEEVTIDAHWFESL